MADREPYDSGNETHVRRAQERAKREQQQQDNDLLEVMSTLAGRRFLLRVLGMCGIYRDDFAPNALTMANLAGMRKVGLILLDELQRVDGASYIRMLAEAQTDPKEDTNG